MLSAEDLDIYDIQAIKHAKLHCQTSCLPKIRHGGQSQSAQVLGLLCPFPQFKTLHANLVSGLGVGNEIMPIKVHEYPRDSRLGQARTTRNFRARQHRVINIKRLEDDTNAIDHRDRYLRERNNHANYYASYSVRHATQMSEAAVVFLSPLRRIDPAEKLIII
ncbi:hypothetical protein BLJ79_08835 [Arthrobacter sp. UCD-GKA]|nr:hypothetical protein BLJ79_08835 [Arthrobacter sp. UCD-GKA]